MTRNDVGLGGSARLDPVSRFSSVSFAGSADRAYKDIGRDLPLHLRLAFCTSLDVNEHPLVNGLDDGVRPEAPVSGWPQVMLVPGCSLQECPSARQFDQTELASSSHQEPVEMGRMDLGKRVPLAHRRRVTGHGEPEQARLVPDLDRLDERAGRELATADGPDALPFDRGSDRVRQTGAKDPITRRGAGQRIEPDDMGPDPVRRGLDLDAGTHAKHGRLGLRRRLGPDHARQSRDQARA